MSLVSSEESTWKKGCSLIGANQFQPDCCASLVLEWMRNMHVGESSAEAWCKAAHDAGEAGDFYARHISNNNQITVKGEIANIRTAYDVGNILLEQGYIDAGFDIKDAIRPRILQIKNSAPLKAFLQRCGMRILGECSTNCEATLYRELAKLADSPRYYMLRFRATTTSHAIGLISTKSEGYFSPSGDIFYFDPNNKMVAKWRSREDVEKFLRKAAVDYDGLTLIRKIGFD